MNTYNENRELRYADEKTKINSNQKLERNSRNITKIEESQKKIHLEIGSVSPIRE